MTKEDVKIKGDTVRLYTCNTVVIGSGAAGFAAAYRLFELGQKDVVVVTEDVLAGTSRNAGSDKQTYYKLTLSGNEPDSVREMAETLFEGGRVDGDTAYCEAACSVRCFYTLTELGVPFPQSHYGEAVGYRTDNDPKRRATSAGPYTSRMMTECLEKAVEEEKIPVLDSLLVVSVVRGEEEVRGLCCLDLAAKDLSDAFVLVCAKNVIDAAGGPAGIYEQSAYPKSQHGSLGMALSAGISGKNLTLWQYGLASVSPRFNVSGTYMQVLPRVISKDESGADEQEFLLSAFKTPEEMENLLFLKGYEWPFDEKKESSRIDLLIDQEIRKGRHVYLDYRENPAGNALSSDRLSEEAFSYLNAAGACFGTPVQRLITMNRPAYDYYLDKGIDLKKEPLEIALSAQHNNGGLDVDCFWQTNLSGFFAVGEAAGTHGLKRPGGSALNAGQVGALRAAQYIAKKRRGDPEVSSFLEKAADHLDFFKEMVLSCMGKTGNVKAAARKARIRMSKNAAAVRDLSGMRKTLCETKEDLKSFRQKISIEDMREVKDLFLFHESLLTQSFVLQAMIGEEEEDKKSEKEEVQIVSYKNHSLQISWRPVRPLPEEDDFFENVWKTYRENENIF